MKTLFYVHKVTSLEEFKKVVTEMTRLEDARLFTCYILGNTFRIATATKVQDFDFTDFKSEDLIIEYIEEAIRILSVNLPDHKVLMV